MPIYRVKLEVKKGNDDWVRFIQAETPDKAFTKYLDFYQSNQFFKEDSKFKAIIIEEVQKC